MQTEALTAKSEPDSELDLLYHYAGIANGRIYSSQADLEPKDRPMPEVLEWCERQGNIIVMKSGLILAVDPSSRTVQNCKILLSSKNIRPRRVVPATETLIKLLLSGAKEEDRFEEILNDPNNVSLQQQRLRLLVGEAIAEQVSDIHIEVRQDVTHVRFRRHGELYLHTEWTARVGREVSAVAFNRETDHAITHFNPIVPQTASMPLHIDGVDVRLRLASLPAHGGFDVVMRVLTAGREVLFSLHELGYTPDQIILINKATQLPNGAVIVAGPTGSGKTTTLASCMQMVQADRKVYTIEDPVEKIINNATQVPVNVEKEDLDFANMGRSALRMDPDVMVLGELREEETAKVLMRAAITGHLVFTTVHTNSASAIVTRFVDMGISPILLADPSVLSCLICQRLVPKLCSHCAIPVTSSVTHWPHLARWRAIVGDDIDRMKGRGTSCRTCKGTGISGRTVVAEIIWVDEIGRQFIQRCDTLGWEKYLKEQGWMNYREHALRLVRNGICDPLDIERLIGSIQHSHEIEKFDYRKSFALI